MKTKVCSTLFLLIVILGIQAGAKSRIMALGNPVTEFNSSNKNYQYPQWIKLVNSNFSCDLIGSIPYNFLGYPTWPVHNGLNFDQAPKTHWNWQADEILDGRNGESKLADWWQCYMPDIILLYSGANDIEQAQTVSSSIAELQQIVGAIRTRDTKGGKLLTKLITSSSTSERKAAIAAFNEQVPALALKLPQSESPVILVNHISKFNSNQGNFDGTYPNAPREGKTAFKWFEALSNALSSVGTTNNLLPVIKLNSPGPGTVFSQGDVIFIKSVATDSDGRVSKVEFFVNGTKVGEDNNSPYEVTWTATSAGDYAITAKATDNKGGMTRSEPVKMSVLAGSGKIYRILPLGNSITYDNIRNDTRPAGVKASYRYKLWQLLKQDGYKIDFVGSKYSGYDFFPDANNGGMPGIRDDQMVSMLINGKDHTGKQQSPGPYLETYPADIILLHIGTNGVDEKPGDVESILKEIDKYEIAHNTSITVILAQIINRAPYSSVTSTFNQNIKAMAEARIVNGDKIVIVNMETDAGLVYSTKSGGDMQDDLHPNVSGNEKMAKVWHRALKKVIDGLNNSVPGVRLQSAFPNPAVNDVLTLLFSSDIISSLLINITDISGKLVQQESANIISGRNAIPLNLASLSPGTYFINIIVLETGKIIRYKMVKI